jgi:hypothetical protein
LSNLDGHFVNHLGQGIFAIILGQAFYLPQSGVLATAG